MNHQLLSLVAQKRKLYVKKMRYPTQQNILEFKLIQKKFNVLSKTEKNKYYLKILDNEKKILKYLAHNRPIQKHKNKK